MSENFSRLGTLTIIMKSGAPKQYLKIKKTFVKWLASKFHYQGNKIMLTSMKQLHSLIFFFPHQIITGQKCFFLVKILCTKLRYVKGFFLILRYFENCDAQDGMMLLLMSVVCWKNSEIATTKIFKCTDEEKNNKRETKCNMDKKGKQLW